MGDNRYIILALSIPSCNYITDPWCPNGTECGCLGLVCCINHGGRKDSVDRQPF